MDQKTRPGRGRPQSKCAVSPRTFSEAGRGFRTQVSANLGLIHFSPDLRSSYFPTCAGWFPTCVELLSNLRGVVSDLRRVGFQLANLRGVFSNLRRVTSQLARGVFQLASSYFPTCARCFPTCAELLFKVGRLEGRLGAGNLQKVNFAWVRLASGCPPT